MKHILLFALMAIATLTYGQEFSKKNVQLVDAKTKNLADAPKKMFIKSFKIYYQMIAEAETTAQGGRQLGGNYVGSATARMAVGVEGIDPEHLQNLTNEIYDYYIGELERKGFEVYTADNLGSTEYFEGWTKIDGPTINEEQIQGSLMVIPENYSYYVKKVTKKGKEKTGAFMSGVTGDDGSFTSSFYGPNPKLSKDLEDMFVVEVSFNIPSIWLSSNNKLGSAKIKGGPNLQLSQAKISYISGKLNKPGVASPETAIETILSGAIPISGVFKDEKFKTVANRSYTYVPSYASYFSVDDKSIEVTNTIACDPIKYQTEVKKPIKGFMDMSFELLELGLAGEKVKF